MAGNPLLARGEVQVKGVAEDKLVAELGHLGCGESADAGLRRERDESWRPDLPVAGSNQARSRGAVTGPDLKLEPGRVASHAAQAPGLAATTAS